MHHKDLEGEINENLADGWSFKVVWQRRVNE
jgi:hypothetical protein